MSDAWGTHKGKLCHSHNSRCNLLLPPLRQIRIKAFLRLLRWKMEQRWYYQPQSMVSIKARGVQQGWLSKAEIRDAGLKDTMPAGALGMLAVSVYVCVSGWVWEWGRVGVCVCVCVCVVGCLHGCVNEEVISGVNAWQRAKRWPLQGGNRGEVGKGL